MARVPAVLVTVAARWRSRFDGCPSCCPCSAVALSVCGAVEWLPLLPCRRSRVGGRIWSGRLSVAGARLVSARSLGRWRRCTCLSLAVGCWLSARCVAVGRWLPVGGCLPVVLVTMAGFGGSRSMAVVGSQSVTVSRSAVSRSVAAVGGCPSPRFF